MYGVLGRQREGVTDEKAILGFVLVAIVVAAAQPAGAVDAGFQWWYRFIGHQTDGDFCPQSGTYRHLIGSATQMRRPASSFTVRR
jgi:hypothetical protein